MNLRHSFTSQQDGSVLRNHPHASEDSGIASASKRSKSPSKKGKHFARSCLKLALGPEKNHISDESLAADRHEANVMALNGMRLLGSLSPMTRVSRPSLSWLPVQSSPAEKPPPWSSPRWPLDARILAPEPSGDLVSPGWRMIFWLVSVGYANWGGGIYVKPNRRSVDQIWHRGLRAPSGTPFKHR